MPDDPQPSSHRPATVDLVRRAQAGDGAAFALLHGEFVRVVHGIVLAHGPRAEAEDLTQDVFVNAFQRLSELQQAEAFPGWLCTTARNAATDACRRRARRPAVVGLPGSEAAGLTDGGPGPAGAAEHRDAAERVLEVVRGLPATYRETLTLRLCEGLSGAEIAARTGMTPGSVRVNLTRGMAMLRPLLQEAGLP